MANFKEIDLMSIGKHCDETSCHQLDFLPFTCDFCTKCFWKMVLHKTLTSKISLEHCDPRQHSCESFIEKNSQLLKCPLCEQYVLKGKGIKEDNDQMEKHIMSGCTDLIMHKRKKNKCQSSGCRQINLIPFQCDLCYQQYCVRHRHSDDHNCIKQHTRRTIAVK